MTTKDEALKMALEALEFIRRWGEPEEGVLKRDEAITAILEVLASKSEALNATLADSALERMAENERELGLDYMEPAQPSQSRSDVKPWVGLTEDEVKHQWEIWRASIPRYVGFAKGIEAKLREKNEHRKKNA